MLSLIVAYDENKVIGNENSIPWKLRADMLRVKTLTTNQTIIMGRKTFDSIGKALPNRVNRVLTRDKNSLSHIENIEIYNDKEEILKNIKTEKVFIFGGSSIYEEYLDKCDERFITEVKTKTNGDSKFPEFDISKWKVLSKESFLKDEKNEFDYTFLHLIRKKED